jgi:hypothetical protein
MVVAFSYAQRLSTPAGRMVVMGLSSFSRARSFEAVAEKGS